MDEAPWLTIIGIGEDGPDGLTAASQAAIGAADVVMGSTRHLGLLPGTAAKQIVWPVPFADGLTVLDGLRGRKVVVLASGDPFWFGAGSVIARRYAAHEWRAIPGVSTFSLVAATMGWPLETATCLGLHAAPLSRLRPHLQNGAKLIVLLRDGAAVSALADYLEQTGFGQSTVTMCQSVGGPNEQIAVLKDQKSQSFDHPVCAAIDVAGGRGLPRASGLPDDLFDTDGQMTKRPMRALSLSALAPNAGALLWDIGGGSGTIGIEWLLSDPSTQAISIETRPDRAARIRENAMRLGVDRLQVIEGTAPDALAGLPKPDAVFVGGGLSDDLLTRLQTLAPGARLVVNAVTLEAEALLAQWQTRCGGSLMRIDLAHMAPLGSKRGWQATYPVVQWSTVL